MLALVSYITGEVLSYTAMPVGAVCLIEELFDEFTYIFLCVTLLIHGLVNETLYVGLHLLIHFAYYPFD